MDAKVCLLVKLRGVAPYAGAWINERVPVIYKPFYVREKFTFFSPCVKYVFDCHRPALSQFFGLFCTFDVGR